MRISDLRLDLNKAAKKVLDTVDSIIDSSPIAPKKIVLNLRQIQTVKSGINKALKRRVRKNALKSTGGKVSHEEITKAYVNSALYKELGASPDLIYRDVTLCAKSQNE